MTKYSEGDIILITTASYQRRRFTVVEVSRHRTTLRGIRGAHRILVEALGSYSIYEDDGERNRGQPCTVESIEASSHDTDDAHEHAEQASGWRAVSDHNRLAAASSLARALERLVAGDLASAKVLASEAAAKLQAAHAFDYVARVGERRGT